MFSKILIANRGEIACRVAATAKRLGVKTVAVYSEADAKAKHVQACDEAVLIGGPAPRDSYLQWQRILDAALTVFGEVGYHQCSIDRIAKEAGCSRISFYQYFAGKEDVFRQLAGQVARQISASVEARRAALAPSLLTWVCSAQSLRSRAPDFRRPHEKSQIPRKNSVWPRATPPHPYVRRTTGW